MLLRFFKGQQYACCYHGSVSGQQEQLHLFTANDNMKTVEEGMSESRRQALNIRELSAKDHAAERKQGCLPQQDIGSQTGNYKNCWPTLHCHFM